MTVVTWTSNNDGDFVSGVSFSPTRVMYVGDTLDLTAQEIAKAAMCGIVLTPGTVAVDLTNFPFLLAEVVDTTFYAQP